MFCRKCGQEIMQGAKFCTKCGTQVQPVPQQAPQMNPNVQPVPPQAPKKKIGTGAIVGIIVGAIALVLVIGVVLWTVLAKGGDSGRDDSDSDNRNHRVEETEEADRESISKDTEGLAGTESVGEEVTGTESIPEESTESGSVVEQSLTLEQYAERLNICDLNGTQYGYYADENIGGAYVTSGLKGVSGCLAYEILDLDGDGSEELLAFQLQENSENGNDILAQVYENRGTEIVLADATVIAGYLLGTSCDKAEIRMLVKDQKYICLDYEQLSFLAADGLSLGMRVFTYNGTELEEYLTYDVAGSSLEDTGRYATDTLQKLRAMNLPKSAENLELRDTFSFCVADTGLDVLAKIRVDNSYSYSNFSEQTTAPVATCYLISGRSKAQEYILPNSSETYLTAQDLEGLSKTDLRIARNEIYARYGWVFEDETLRQHFENQSWYKTADFGNVSDDQLTELEKANRDLIISYE